MAEKFLNMVKGASVHTLPELQIGFGDPKAEFASCEEVEVFVRLCGAQFWSYRGVLPKDTKLNEVKAFVEKNRGLPIAQQVLQDENGYTFAQLGRPLWSVSNKCRLVIDLVHSDGHVLGSENRGWLKAVTIANIPHYLQRCRFPAYTQRLY